MKNLLSKTYTIIFLLLFSVFTPLSAQDDAFSFNGVVKFDKVVHDFGDILISEGAKKCTFTYTNISDKPIIINDVISSCGCTTPKWSRKPLNPGESAEISVTFLNDQGPFPFDKSIVLFISDVQRPITLHIKGIAHSKRKSMSELFPYSIDNILGMRKKEISAGYIEQGNIKKGSFEIANLTKKRVNVTFTNVSPELALSIDKNTLSAGERTTVSFTIDTKKSREKAWGNTKYFFSVKANDLTPHRLEIDAFIRDNFVDYTPDMKRDAPLPRLSKSSHSIVNIKQGEKVSFNVDIRNIGRNDLIIHKIDIDNDGVTVKYPKLLKADVDNKIDISVDTSHMKGDITVILSIITNSPTRPIANFYITGTVL